ATNFRLGLALSRSWREEEATIAFRRAVELNPDLAEGHYNLANCLERTGKYAEAEAPLRKAIKLKPDYAEAYCNLGSVLRCRGRFEESLEAIRQGHQLGSQQDSFRNQYPSSAQWVKNAERLIALAPDL